MKKIMLFVMLLIIPFSISAKTLGDLKKELEDFELEQRENEYNKNLTKEEIKKIYDSMAVAEKKMDDIFIERDKIIKDIENFNVQIKEKDKETKDIINFLQVSSGESAYLEYAFGAKDFTDFIYRFSVTEQLTKYNQEAIEEFNHLIKENENRQVELSENEKELERIQAQYSADLKKLGSKLNDIGDLELSLEEQIKGQKEAIDMYENKLGCKDDEDIETCGRNKLPPGTAFFRPVDTAHITSEFGSRCFTLNGSWYCDFHYGVDMSHYLRTPDVYSTANGVVSLVIYRSSCGGNQIYIQHNINGTTYTSHYAHLYSVNVKKGDVVTINTVIGKMGGSPSLTPYDKCSTGQHLHFSLAKGLHPDGTYSWWSNFLGAQLKPRSYVNFPSGGTIFEDRFTKY